MKKYIYYIIAMAVGFLGMSSLAVNAQEPETLKETIKMYKTINPVDAANGKYEIKLEAFVTSNAIVTEITEPIDIVMCLDLAVEVNSHGLTEVVAKAAEDFVDTVYDMTPKDVSAGYHNLALVTFGSDDPGYKVEFGLTPLDATKKGQMDTRLAQMHGSNFFKNGTYIDRGLTQAYNLLNAESIRNDGRKKIVVVFEAGAPKASTSGNDRFDFEAGISAINTAHTLKSFTYTTDGGKVDNLKIYTVAPESEITSKFPASKDNHDVARFLNYLSSNFNFAISNSNYQFGATYPGVTGIDSQPHDYYRTCTEGVDSDLSDIFKQIAKEIAGDIVELHDETTAVVDIVSQNFIVPSTVTPSNVTLEVWKVVEFDPRYEKVEFQPILDVDGKTVIDGYYWGYRFAYDEAYTNAHKPVALLPDSNTLQVSNFDFAKADDKYESGDKIGQPIPESGNWVGPRTINGHDSYWGRKVVIKFPIELNPDYQGGYVMPSNDINSGLYIDTNGDNEFEESEIVKPFPVPHLDFPSICIVKEGLKPGESAVFKVTYPNGTSHNVVLTQRGTAGAKLPCFVVLKRLDVGTYKVTETNWSWMYDVSPASEITHSVKDPESVDITTDYLTDDATSTKIIIDPSATNKEIGRQATKVIDGETIPFCMMAGPNLDYSSSAISVLFYFSNTRNESGKPARSEAFVHNQFKGLNASNSAEIGGTDPEEQL